MNKHKISPEEVGGYLSTIKKTGTKHFAPINVYVLHNEFNPKSLRQEAFDFINILDKNYFLNITHVYAHETDPYSWLMSDTTIFSNDVLLIVDKDNINYLEDLKSQFKIAIYQL